MLDYEVFKMADLSELKDAMDTLDDKPIGATYDYECRLTESCIPRELTVKFWKPSPNTYGLFTDPHFAYSGGNLLIKMLSDVHALKFDCWNTFEQGLRLIGEGDNVSPAPSLNTPSVGQTPQLESDEGMMPRTDVSTITDWDLISMPESNTAVRTVDYLDILSKLSQSIMGQEDQLKTISFITAQHVNKLKPNKPVSFMFSGPPGVGKSETAKVLASALTELTGHHYSELKIDFNTFTEAHTVHRLTGAPAGYIGYDDEPLFETIAKNERTVVVADEIDKAHPEVLKIFMSILDAGECIANKPRPDGSREYNFKNCIFIFTSNYNLASGDSSVFDKQRIGFIVRDFAESSDTSDEGVTVDYENAEQKEIAKTLPMQIYEKNEQARKNFVKVGTLREIASRFQCFVNFDPLSKQAKCKILAKQIVESGLEYSHSISYIAPGIMQGIFDAAMSGDSLTVRSFRAIIEGYLAPLFASTEILENQTYRLEGTLDAPRMIPQ